MDARVQKVLIVLLLAGLVLVLPAGAVDNPTTSLTVKKLADDGVTVLNQRTVTYQWMEATLPNYGDGVTHYYHQGPTFDPNNLWDSGIAPEPAPGETINVDSRDYGAAVGTDVKDLCDLVGGMNSGEEVKIKAQEPDQFSKTFDYEDVYAPEAEQGKLIIAWKNPTFGGYVPAYTTGMRLIFFADPETGQTKHVFGNWDMHEYLAPNRWHFFTQDKIDYPSSSGLSVQNVGEIIIYSDDPAPETDVLYDGTVTLTKDATFSQEAYNNPGSSYTVEEDTPLGALHATGLTYDVTDKMANGVLLLDNVDGYLRDKTNKIYWYAYVNDVNKDGYNGAAEALNLMEIVDGDRVEFYYAGGITDPTNMYEVKGKATAAVKTVANIPPPDYPVAKFHAEPETGFAPLNVHFIDESTGAATLSYDWDFQNDGTVDSHEQSPFFTYDDAGTYTVKLTVTNSYGSDEEVKTIDVQAPSTDWTLALSGARTETVTRSYFEDGMVHAPDTHYKEYTDASGTWSGMPLYLLLGMVDDNPDPGTPYHWNFNDALATQGYNVKITASDGYTATLSSKDIESNLNGFIVANKLKGEYLPALTPAGKTSWPLHLVGTAVGESGNKIGGIVKIELIFPPPPPPTGWTLKLIGDVTDTITQAEFEAAVAHGHTASYTETVTGNVYTGVPLWYLVGAVDDLETTDHWTFSNTRAATHYALEVRDLDTEGTPPSPYIKTFYSDVIGRNDNYIIANKKNGADLPTGEYPLRLVGIPVEGKTPGKLGGLAVGEIDEIAIPSMVTPAPAPGSYNLALVGKISDVLSQAELEAAINCPEHQRTVSVTDKYGNTALYRGMPLWNLAGWVDDRTPHGPDGFNAAQAVAGYKIIVADLDSPYSKDFSGSAVAWSDDYIIANQKSTDGGTTFVPLSGSEWPLRIVGAGAKGGYSVSGIDSITLTDFGAPVQAPTLHIVKYGADGTSVVAEATTDYTQMMAQFDTIGDGITLYKFQGVTNDPTDIWGQYDETKGGSKISNAVKGTRLLDLVSLVGDMGPGTDLVLVASDGYKTTLPYTSVHTTTDIQARQGDAILAWYADGKFVPGYADGMRLYFMPGDHVYGQWDMHETMPAGYWHYFYQTYDPPSPYAPGILYPSAAGLSAKYVTEIHVYTTPETTWNLQLDGTRVGGIAYTVAKPYFEAALACQMGANHAQSYTDSSGNVWLGMPLWFLAGFVDDADQHSNNAYNEPLAQAGYDITIIGSGGFTKVFDSVPTIRSNDFIVANTKNGIHILATDTKNWPLKLMGAGVASSGKLQVGGINTIILNLRPKIDSLTVPTAPVLTAAAATATAAFTDPYDTHTAVFDWGDGLTSAGVVDETTHTVTGTHAYALPGFYTVKVTLKDSMSVEATATSSTQVIVYDPKSGFVTGLGSITSPVGAYAANPSLTGPATIELLARYPVVINKPFTGVTAFQFLKAKMAFASTSYDWLVLQKEAKKAFYQGSGTINGRGDYKFLVSVIDGGSKPALDKFRIKIWNKATGAVVYDTQPGFADTADPTTPLTLGVLVIDKLGK